MKEGYGEFIRKHRIASGYKRQIQLAEKSGVSATTISRIEKEHQKPSVETLKELAPHLQSTSYVELMVVCGYWDEDELLDELELKEDKIISHETVKREPIVRRVKIKTPSTEEEFIESIDLTDKELINEYDLQIDGMSLTENEAAGVIAYIRTLRNSNQNKN